MRCRKAHFLWTTAFLAVLPVGAGIVRPVPLPDPRVPGFQFPESEATVLGWVYQLGNGSPSDAATAFESMHVHAWGLWTALSLPTSQIDNGERLRVFETWFTPQELSSGPNPTTLALSRNAIRSRSALLRFNQFQHGTETVEPVASTDGSEAVFGYVKFDPTAADHINSQQLLSTATLNQLMIGGAQQIPPFPSTALTLKSAFEVVTARSLIGKRYYRLNVWTGPPKTPQAWPPTAWPGVVWIDVLNGGRGRGAIDFRASLDATSRTDATTYPVSSMINHRLSALEAMQYNSINPGANAAAGNYAVLVAMHVAGREITRWTWQTFWWTPTPDDPQVPSSQAIAGLRPAQLTGAARNYAMSLAYDMTIPGQPNVGGQNAGMMIYAYNPYLEARFGSADLPNSLATFAADGTIARNNVGVNCNCMSCHIRANYNPALLNSAPKYSGARYTSLSDLQFTGTLQVDLLWSLPEIAK
ncbi:MAG TPA: hypothetical protein VGF85_12080 [Opitutaceae bacterium]|jgi:hypothetical protein